MEDYRELVYVENVDDDGDTYKMIMSCEKYGWDGKPETPLQWELENTSDLSEYDIELPAQGYYILPYSYHCGFNEWDGDYDNDFYFDEFEKAKISDIVKYKLRSIPVTVLRRFWDLKQYFEPIWNVTETGYNDKGEPSVGHYPYQDEYLPISIVHALYFYFKKDHDARWFASNRKISIER